MTKHVVPIILKSFSLGLVIAAGGLWACSGVDPRPIYKDQQVLIGGTIWSQIVIPLGLIISKVVEDNLDNFVHGYFLISGAILLGGTGAVLIVGEYKIIQRRQRRDLQQEPPVPPKLIIKEKDKVNIVISIIVLIAALFTFSEFLIVIFMD
ncbi:uncharacterized protein LOC101740239 [Bombyx mori]|uniref:Uncharacterized protein n=1 Tax=Bombyx mori TaxID=7091 RepID=A0A8R1WLS3_BOMMO|nr:uncharacterized protein LOC101740239 [Bombyx mori]